MYVHRLARLGELVISFFMLASEYTSANANETRIDVTDLMYIYIIYQLIQTLDQSEWFQVCNFLRITN